MPQAASDEEWLRVMVVFPARNKACNLPHVFSGLAKRPHEVIVADGHSVDDTFATARQLRPDVRIIMENREGKGNTLRCCCSAISESPIASAVSSESD